MVAFYFTAAQYAGVTRALAIQASAPDTQLHVDVVELLAPAAKASLLWETEGAFAQECRDKPFGALLKLLKYCVGLSAVSDENPT